MEIIRGSGNEWAAITSGFAEVDGTRCVVLVDSCSLASQIDAAEAESRRSAAAEALGALSDDEANAGEQAGLAALVARAELELDVVNR